MKIYKYIVLIFFVALSCCFAERDWPNNYYFKGVEDRFEQADVVVIGEAWLRGDVPEIEKATCPAKIELVVKEVIKGEKVPKQISYDVVYNSFTLSTHEQPDTPMFSKEDKLAFSMSKTIAFWEFNKPESIVVLLKEKDSQLIPFRVYWSTFNKDCMASFPRIYKAEKMRIDSGSLKDIYNLLTPEEPTIVREYAIRTILKSEQPWSKTCEILTSHIDALDAAYASGAITAHSRIRQLKGSDLDASIELLNSIVAKTVNEKQKQEVIERIKQNHPTLSSKLSPRKK